MEQAGGEWFYNNTLNEPIAARYIQIVPDRADKSRSIKNLQINGCRLGKLVPLKIISVYFLLIERKPVIRKKIHLHVTKLKDRPGIPSMDNL